VHGRKETGVPALSLPFDMRETMAVFERVRGELPSSRGLGAVVAYLVTHFSEKATTLAATVLKSSEGNIETVCEELKRFEAGGGKAGVSRFRNQSLEARLGVMRQLSMMEWKQFKSLTLWTEQVARDVKGIDSFGAMRVAIVLLHDGCFNLMGIAGEAPFHLPRRRGPAHQVRRQEVPRQLPRTAEGHGGGGS
jgi:hypothetical protein